METQLTPTDLNFVLVRTPKDVRKLMQDYGLILAGGFIRATIAGENPADIDLFGPSEEVLKNAANALCVARKTARIHRTNNAWTVCQTGRIPVQFVTRWTFPTLYDCLNSFDFTIARAGISWDNHILQWISITDMHFYPDLAARRLTYMSPVRNEDAGGSIMRVRKFLAAGYNIQAASFGGVLARLLIGVRKSGLTYDTTNEGALALVITGLLREVDPLVVVDGMLIDEHETVDGKEDTTTE